MIQSLWLLLPLLLSRAPSQPITFPTEPPVLLEDGYAPLDLLPEKEFREAMKERVSEPGFVPLKEPSGLSAKALFDLALVLDQSVTLAVEDEAERGYSLFVDLDADGRLDNEKAWPMTQGTVTLPGREPRQAFLGEIRTTLKRSVEGKEIDVPFAMKVAITGNTIRLPGREAPRREALATVSNLRTGIVTLPGASVRFALRGEGGIYDYDYAAVLFDVDGNGAMDAVDRTSPEFYWVWEKTVNLGGRSYAYHVDRYGRSLTLVPVKKAPDRADLRPDHPAPDFSFRDLSGKKRRLADYRGKVVLLDFWGTWCPACVVHAGDLARAYEELRPQGFEIIGIHEGGTAKAVEEFASRYDLTWPQTLESDESPAGRPLYRLYRVLGAPAYFLIGERGELILSDEHQPAVVIRAARERLRRP